MVFDVDGVLTDGGLYYDANGQYAKRFDVQDGLGIKAAQAVGLNLAVITGLDSRAVYNRVSELDIEEYVAGRVEKASAFEAICDRFDVTPEQAAYVGDDWVDAGPMRLAGLPMAVPNAQPEILRLAMHVLSRPGGRGAVREAIRLVLFCQGCLNGELESWRRGEALGRSSSEGEKS
ncbi:KdsC family phosphatase [Oceanidesulfovibrio indonesiensis]|nr:HAD hydrolase family protein [Oceanidesulfovibrio indonesiensis]